MRPDAGKVARRGKKTAAWLALPKGMHGRALCRFCSTEVGPRRWTFCSDECVHEWKLQTSPSYVRKCLLKRDKGICCECGFNAHALKLRLRRLRRTDPLAWHAAWEEMLARGVPSHRKTFWDAAHVVAVVEGGGYNYAKGLTNLVTKCIFCHKKDTASLAGRRAGK